MATLPGKEIQSQHFGPLMDSAARLATMGTNSWGKTVTWADVSFHLAKKCMQHQWGDQKVHQQATVWLQLWARNAAGRRDDSWSLRLSRGREVFMEPAPLTQVLGNLGSEHLFLTRDVRMEQREEGFFSHQLLSQRVSEKPHRICV